MSGDSRGVLKRLASALSAADRERNPVVWQPTGSYPRLVGFNSRELAGRPGLYLLWHLGVRPQWLRVGFSADLGTAVSLLAKRPEVVAFEAHDGPYLSWHFCAAHEAPGLVNFLAQRLGPALQDLPFSFDAAVDAAAPAVACVLPAGTKAVQNALNIHADRR